MDSQLYRVIQCNRMIIFFRTNANSTYSTKPNMSAMKRIWWTLQPSLWCITQWPEPILSSLYHIYYIYLFYSLVMNFVALKWCPCPVVTVNWNWSKNISLLTFQTQFNIEIKYHFIGIFIIDRQKRPLCILLTNEVALNQSP